ncbi:hypothetical protein BGIGA_561 [Blattabacterium sp. (Blaberus giganteus)]|nr:hypothetical protein BGIGA_561 [Blattabacterium sp. (Blaberus giganteus)]
MIKKIAIYNLFTFFFSLIHMIFSIFFFKIYFIFILKIYVFSFPVNSLFFLFCLFTTKNRCKFTTYIYMLCDTMRLFFSVLIFFYSIFDSYDLSNFSSSFLLKALIHFIFSYFMTLFFRVIFLLN